MAQYMYANTSYYLPVALPSTGDGADLPLSLMPSLWLQDTGSFYSILQSAVICAIAVLGITVTLLPTPQWKTTITTRLVRSMSGTNLVVIVLIWVMSSVRSTISADNFSKLLLTWFITYLLDLPNRLCYGAQQENRKDVVSNYRISPIEADYLLNLISKVMDKLIIFAVIIASILLFFGSLLYMSLVSTTRWICKSPYYKGTLQLLEPFVTKSKKKCLSVAQSFSC